MFDKEESKKFVSAKINNINLKKVGKYLLTTTAIVLLSKPILNFDNSLDKTTIWEKNMYKYVQKVYNDNSNYDPLITELFHNGIFVYNNKNISIESLFLTYGLENNEFKTYLIDTKQGYFDLLTGNSIEFERMGALRLRDTTAFIRLLNDNETIQIVDNNLIVLNVTKIQDIIDSWDGYIHDEVKETNNAFKKIIVDRGNFDGKRK